MEYESEREERIFEAIRAAESELRLIDDDTAQLIAERLAHDDATALRALANRGAVHLTGIQAEVSGLWRQLDAQVKADLKTILLVWALMDYVEARAADQDEAPSQPEPDIEAMSAFLADVDLTDINEILQEYHDRYVGHFKDMEMIGRHYARRYGVQWAIGNLALDDFIKPYIRFSYRDFGEDLWHNGDISVLDAPAGGWFVFDV